MDQPVSKSHKSTLPNHSIGLNSDKIDEMNINHAVFQYVSRQAMAPTPKGTVGACDTMRKRILQVSLFPDIYDKNKKVKNPGNVDFGNKEDTY